MYSGELELELLVLLLHLSVQGEKQMSFPFTHFDLTNMFFCSLCYNFTFLKKKNNVQLRHGLRQQQRKAQHQQSAKRNGKNIHDIRTQEASQVFALKSFHQACFKRDEEKVLKE